MGDGGVACVAASQNFMEHFTSSAEPYCGNNDNDNSNSHESGDNNVSDSKADVHGSENENNENSTQLLHLQDTNSPHGGKEGSSASSRPETADNSKANVKAMATITTLSNCDVAVAGSVPFEQVDRPKRTSRWDVIEERNDNGTGNRNVTNSNVRENGGVVGLHMHDDEGRHDELLVHREVEVGVGGENAGREHFGKSRRGGLEDLHSRSGYHESNSNSNSGKNSSDRHHHRSCSSSRGGGGAYDSRHSRHYELSSSSCSRSAHERHYNSSRQSGSADRDRDRDRDRDKERDRSYTERSPYPYDRRWQYDRNGYKKYHGRYGSSQGYAYEDRKFHRRERESSSSRRHSSSSYRQSQSHSGWDRDQPLDESRQSNSNWIDRVMDDSKSKGRHSNFSSTATGHARSSYSTHLKDSSRTPASDRSEIFIDEFRSEKEVINGKVRSSEQNVDVLSERSKHEKLQCRGWFYIDHLGIEQGPLRLRDLKMLTEDGQLQSDHLVRREGSHEWVTIENAASPMPFGNLQHITSKLFPQEQVNETSSDRGRTVANRDNIQRMRNCNNTLSVKQDDYRNDRFEGLYAIDERVEKLMQGFHLIPGRESQIISEALGHASRRVDHYAESEGSPSFQDGINVYRNHWLNAELGRGFESESNASKVVATGATAEKDYDKDASTTMVILFGSEGSSQFSGRWPSKGGDWRRTTENIGGGDRFSKKKIVLNDGVLLCDIWKSGVGDPRRSLREVYYHATPCQRLELPPWAYHWQEQKIDPVYKTENAYEVNVHLGHGSILTPKANASTSKFHFSTSQISTPKGTVVSLCGHDGLKSTRTNNGDLVKSLIGNKSNQHMSSAIKVSNICKSTSSFQCEMKSVLKSNATVFKESGSLAWELHAKSQYMGYNAVRAEEVRDQSLHCGLPVEGVHVSAKVHESELRQMPEAEAMHPDEPFFSANVRTVNELKLDTGEWYYRDGAGHEKGPFTFAQLQMLVFDGALQRNSSVYRKSDHTWVPISDQVSATLKPSEKKLIVDSLCQPPGTVSPARKDQEQNKPEDCTTDQPDFHALYPHFVGYARGKLHEHVMKSYRSREFAAAIGEVLDAWLNPKQSKNSLDTLVAGRSISRPFSVKNIAATCNNTDNGAKLQNYEGKRDWMPKRGSNHIFSCSDSEKGVTHNKFETGLANNHSHGKRQDACKRRRLQTIQEGEKVDIAISELEADFAVNKLHGCSNQEATIHLEDNSSSTHSKLHGWDMMDPHVLVRVFHFLENDLKSIACSAATCKCWNTAVRDLKSRSRQVDFSSLGPECTDAVFQSIMGGYGEAKIKHVILKGCIYICADSLIDFLCGWKYQTIESVDITGCHQFKDSTLMLSNVKWEWQRSDMPGPSSSGEQSEETHCKVKSLKQINDKIYGPCRSSRAQDINTSDDSGGRDMLMPPPEADHGEPMDVDFQVDSKVTVSPVDRRAYSAKRIKLYSSGKSMKIQMVNGSSKGEASVKSSAVDKNFEKLLAGTLKKIMSVDANASVLHDVSEIEHKIRTGFYTGDMQGIQSFKNDIFLNCRQAYKVHKKGSWGHVAAQEAFKAAHREIFNLSDRFEKLSGDMHHQKPANRNETVLRLGKDKSQNNMYSTSSVVKKRYGRGMQVGVKRSKRRKGMSYSDCSDFIEDDLSDRESRRVSKQKKRHWSDSETETSESSGFLDEEFLQKEDDDSDVDNSDMEMKFSVEGDEDFSEEKYAMETYGEELEISEREWGAKMTEASLVPPVTRKYEVVEEYVIVADEVDVRRKMKVCLPDDYEKKLLAAKDKRNGTYVHLELPDLKEYRPRKRLGDEVLEQEVYGIDPYTYNLILDTMPKASDFSLEEQHTIIEDVLLRVLNEKVRDYTGTGRTPIEYQLHYVVQGMIVEAEKDDDIRKKTFYQGLLKNMQSRQSTEKYVAYRKGLGVVCNKKGGFEKDDFVVEFLGEVYPAWRWYEKEDAIRSFQKKNKDPAPEFYNINLERPKGDGDGFDLVVVDAMHKANYASRICHSCRPNCEAKVSAVDGQYQIGLYTIRPIQYGEEITFDYNSLTESKEEYEGSVCLCGSHVCRGSYLSLAGAGTYQKVLRECHGLLNRHHLLLEACTSSVTENDMSDLRSAGVGTCLLSGLPYWAVAYSAHVVRFMNHERSKLPGHILKTIRKEKKKAGIEIPSDTDEWNEAEIQVEGIVNNRLHSLAVTLDKVRYILRNLYQDPTKAPPPLRKLKATELVSALWKGEHSLVEELIRCMIPHVDEEWLKHFKQEIHEHDPSGSMDLEKALRNSLLWLRDELRNMQSSCKSRHDAAADVIHLYAYTKCFFINLDYGPLESPRLYISPLDLGPRYANKLGSGFQEWQKTYGKDYVLGQLIYWYKTSYEDPGAILTKAQKGCLVLPDISSCYVNNHKLECRLGYGYKEHTELIKRMEQQPEKPWPRGEFWKFKNNRLYGSPMFDAVMNNSPLDKEMMQWLKSRPNVFYSSLDH